jgi:hypothetical protein
MASLRLPVNLLPAHFQQQTETETETETETDGPQRRSAEKEASPPAAPSITVTTAEGENKPPGQKPALNKEPPTLAEVTTRRDLDAYSVDALRKLARSISIPLTRMTTRGQVTAALWDHISAPVEGSALLSGSDERIVVLSSPPAFPR